MLQSRDMLDVYSNGYSMSVFFNLIEGIVVPFFHFKCMYQSFIETLITVLAAHIAIPVIHGTILIKKYGSTSN